MRRHKQENQVTDFRSQTAIKDYAFVCFQFLKEITNTSCDKTIEQPTQQYIKDQVLLSPGPVVNYRAFKHGKRSAKTIAEEEYARATESLQEDGFGRVVEFRIPRARSQCKVFVKSKPVPWPNSTTLSDQQYDNAISKPLHSDITAPMRAYLQTNDYI